MKSVNPDKKPGRWGRRLCGERGKCDTAAKVPLEHLETSSNKGKYAFYEVLLLRIAATTKR